MNVTPWSGPLTEEAVRRKLEPGGQLVTRLTFGPGARIRASALERQVIVVVGSCRLTCRGESVVVSRGEQVTVPEGPYELEVLSPSSVEFLTAFRLPAALVARQPPTQ